MSENIPTPLEVANATPEKIFTQEEVNKILADNKRRLREQYADYEDIKSKVEAGYTEGPELEAAKQRADKAEADLSALVDRNMREDIANKHGVPVDLLEGTNETELKACAEAIRIFMDGRQTPAPDPDQGRERYCKNTPFADGLERGLFEKLGIKPAFQ
ncbi:hypothetical protein ACFWPK_28280 [Nocardia sp. NPDC058519]|uniref:hypothetical protein n=1 Tax=Nocardia sp. NPDC058519 TaxID=3346535 RepID=UPI00364A351F